MYMCVYTYVYMLVIRASPYPFVSQIFPVGLRRDRVDIIQLRFNFLSIWIALGATELLLGFMRLTRLALDP